MTTSSTSVTQASEPVAEADGVAEATGVAAGPAGEGGAAVAPPVPKRSTAAVAAANV
ncbi:hypothetical protein GCM10009767_30000 [Kocuria aegyptia]|uniref:Uncharacterized protein n=1 Tax=Kocuria aegyptia TaxID=330943 RepID=A0ABP4X4K8_9MICC